MVEYESTKARGEVTLWTWESLRTWMASKHGGTYRPHELRAIELKWRRIFSEAGFSVKGQ